MKKIVWAVVIIAVLGGLYKAFSWWRAASVPKIEAMKVRVERVTRGDLVEIVQAPAEVIPRNKVSISAKVSARITSLPFLEGAKVKKGDVLVRLDSTDLEAALRSANARYAAQQATIASAESRLEAQKAELEGQRASLIEAELDLKRQKGLLESHDVSQSTVDSAQGKYDAQKASVNSSVYSLKAEQTNMEVLRHNLDAADADIAKAKEDLSYTTIASPIDGIITVINAKEGELVMTGTMNNAGTVILEVADLSQMIARARVDESDVGSVAEGQPVKVHLLAFPDTIFTGTVATVALARTTDREQMGNNNGDAHIFKVEVLLDSQTRRIQSGLTADVEIETKKNVNVLRVPTQAVAARPTENLPAEVKKDNPDVDPAKSATLVVFVYKDGVVHVKPVSVGAADNNMTLVKRGVDEGDLVIAGPYKALEAVNDGDKVELEAPPTTAPATQSAASTQSSSAK